MKKLFLLWSLIAVLTAVSAIVTWMLGGFHFAYKADASKLTFVILAVFAVMTGWCGWLSWKASEVIDCAGKISTYNDKWPRMLRDLQNDARHISTAADICTLLGLLGTICGIIMAFFDAGGFKGAQSKDQLGVAVGTAFITTFAGIVCCVVLMLQHHLLVHAVKRKQIELTPEVRNE